MASDIDNLVAARSQAIANLLALENAGPQAWTDYSTSGPGGSNSYQYAQAKKQLCDSIANYTAMIQMLGGPWIIRSRSK